MPQATNAISSVNFSVEVSTNGSVWTDIGGHATTVEVDGGERKVGKGFTFVGDTPILFRGKRDSIQLKVRSLYSEGASDVFEIVRNAYDTNSDLYLRWSPQGGQSGEFMFTSSTGIVKECPYPSGDAESEDPVFFDFTLEVLSVSKSVVA